MIKKTQEYIFQFERFIRNVDQNVNVSKIFIIKNNSIGDIRIIKNQRTLACMDKDPYLSLNSDISGSQKGILTHNTPHIRLVIYISFYRISYLMQMANLKLIFSTFICKAVLKHASLIISEISM